MLEKDVKRASSIEILKFFRAFYKAEDLNNAEGIFFGFYTIDTIDVALVKYSSKENILQFIQNIGSPTIELTDNSIKVLQKNPDTVFIYDSRLKIILCSENGEEVAPANSFPVIGDGSRKRVLGLMWDTTTKEYKVILTLFYIEGDILPVRAYLRDCKQFKTNNDPITNFGIYAMTQIASYGRSRLNIKLDIKEPISIDSRTSEIKGSCATLTKLKGVYDSKHPKVKITLRNILAGVVIVDDINDASIINLDIKTVMKCDILGVEINDRGGRKIYFYIDSKNSKENRDKLEAWLILNVYDHSLVVRRQN
jgi:hypothetical protein